MSKYATVLAAIAAARHTPPPPPPEAPRRRRMVICTYHSADPLKAEWAAITKKELSA